MLNWMWFRLGRALPVKFYVLAVSIVGGLTIGAFRLDESVELATAVGIVGGFSIAMGVWLGLRLYLVVTQLYRAWIAAIRKQIADVESRLAPATTPAEERDVERLRDSLATVVAVYSIYPTPAFLCGFLGSAIASALWVQFDYARASMHFGFVLTHLVALVVAVALQCLYPLRLQWQVWSAKRRLNRGELVVTVALKADALDSNINRAERFVRLIGGVGRPAREQVMD